MRRVTVRVHQDGDWLFRAERDNGQMLFEVEFAEDGGTATAPASPEPSPLPSPESQPSLAALLDDERYQRDLDDAIKAFGKNMPQGPPFTRVLEIGGFLGEMTKRLHRITDGERSEPVYMVDPFMPRRDEFAAVCTPENLPNLRQLLAQNIEGISPRMVSGSEQSAADSLAPMGIDLLCISAGTGVAELLVILENWLPHLSASGVLLSRIPTDGDGASLVLSLSNMGLNAKPIGIDWFIATRKEAA
jgi:hypothetical protein